MPLPPRALFGRRPCTSFVSPKAVTYLGLLRVAVASRDRQGAAYAGRSLAVAARQPATPARNPR